jgi:hypothetical protein
MVTDGEEVGVLLRQKLALSVISLPRINMVAFGAKRT